MSSESADEAFLFIVMAVIMPREFGWYVGSRAFVCLFVGSLSGSSDKFLL